MSAPLIYPCIVVQYAFLYYIMIGGTLCQSNLHVQVCTSVTNDCYSCYIITIMQLSKSHVNTCTQTLAIKYIVLASIKFPPFQILVSLINLLVAYLSFLWLVNSCTCSPLAPTADSTPHSPH